MNEQPERILVLDIDEDTLITLEQVLEDAGFDTTTTWDAKEARQLLAREHFDFLILGDHPPELDAAMILRDVTSRSYCGRCLVMESDSRKSEVERFGALGAVALISKRDHLSVLEHVRKHARFPVFRAPPETGAETGCANQNLENAAA